MKINLSKIFLNFIVSDRYFTNVFITFWLLLHSIILLVIFNAFLSFIVFKETYCSDNSSCNPQSNFNSSTYLNGTHPIEFSLSGDLWNNYTNGTGQESHCGAWGLPCFIYYSLLELCGSLCIYLILPKRKL